MEYYWKITISLPEWSIWTIGIIGGWLVCSAIMYGWACFYNRFLYHIEFYEGRLGPHSYNGPLLSAECVKIWLILGPIFLIGHILILPMYFTCKYVPNIFNYLTTGFPQKPD